MAEEKKAKNQGASQGTVRLALGKGDWRVDSFDPSIEGVPALTQEYANVPADKEEAVKASARDHGFTIRKES